MDNFKERLKELIGKMTIEEFSKQIDINSSTIGTWFNSKTMPKLNNMIKLSNYFEYSIEFLVGRSDDETRVPAKECPPFHEQLLKILNQKGLKQTYLRNNGVISSGLNESIFKKHSTVCTESVIKIADFLKISIDELVGRV